MLLHGSEYTFDVLVEWNTQFFDKGFVLCAVDGGGEAFVFPLFLDGFEFDLSEVAIGPDIGAGDESIL